MPTRFYRRRQLVTCYKSIQDECCYKQIADCAYFSFSFTTAPRLTRLRLNVTHFLHSSLRTETATFTEASRGVVNDSRAFLSTNQTECSDRLAYSWLTLCWLSGEFWRVFVLL